jgi:hypothetical protein
MSERWFLNKFLEIATRKYPDSYFMGDIALSWSSDDDYDGPQRFVYDLIELDAKGRLHSWTFVGLRSPELVSGSVIGRMFAGSLLLRRTDPAELRAKLERATTKRRYRSDPERFRRAKGRFDSWNLVVCGGKGCELAGRDDNLVFQLYAPLSRMVGHIDDVNTWQFTQTSTGFDLRSVWDFAFAGALSLEDKLAAYQGRDEDLPAPDDDFDIAAKHDLHLKRKKGFHAEGRQAYFSDRAQILAR